MKLLDEFVDMICGSHLDCSFPSILCDHPALFTGVCVEGEFCELRYNGVLRSSDMLCRAVFLRLAWVGDETELLQPGQVVPHGP